MHISCTRCLQLVSMHLIYTRIHLRTQLVGMRLSERFTLYVHEDANSKGALAVTRRAAAEAGKGRVAEVISSVARSGTGHAFERGGLHKISEHFRAALEAMLSPPPAGRAHSHAILVEDDLLLSNPSPSPNPNSNPNPDPNLSPNPNQDDLLLSPDALLLFWSSAWLLREDPSLWCAAVPTPVSVLTPMLSMPSPFNPPPRHRLPQVRLRVARPGLPPHGLRPAAPHAHRLLPRPGLDDRGRDLGGAQGPLARPTHHRVGPLVPTLDHVSRA